jgi:putative SOS response-associated peptidase YedK
MDVLRVGEARCSRRRDEGHANGAALPGGAQATVHAIVDPAFAPSTHVFHSTSRGVALRRFVQAFSNRDVLPASMPAALATALLAMPDRYNISGRTPAAVLWRDDNADGVGVQAGQSTWGLVPTWSKTPETRYTTVTARLQRAPRSRIFRKPWERQRCVVPMNGYYKWDRSVKPAVPYFIQAQDGKALLAAGLWESWTKGDAPLHTFTILTHPNAAIPAPLVADGPVFLPHVSWDKWITEAMWFPMRYLTALPQPALEAYRVSRAIRDRTRDDYTLLEPAGAGDAAAGLEHGDSGDEDSDAWDDDEADEDR